MEPAAWMLECPMMTGGTGWKLSWSQSGAGVCNRLNGEAHEKPLYLAPVDRWNQAEDAPLNMWVLVNNGGIVDIARLYNTGRWFNTREMELACVRDWMPLPPTPNAEISGA